MVNGNRIRQARELRAFTQHDLASHIGVNQSLIAQIEAGYKQPSQAVLESIAFRTGFPVQFFFQNDGPEFPLGSLLFRSHSSMGSQQRIQSWRYAEILNETIDRLSTHLEWRAIRLKRLKADPIKAAIATRSELGLSPDRPISNLTTTIEKAGVWVFVIPLDMEKSDAFSAWVGEEPCKPMVFLSSQRTGDRVRFSIAHELGHLVIHSSHQKEFREIEREANIFASEFLLPTEAMRIELVPPINLNKLARLKPKWGVSMQTLIQRAREMEAISQRQCHYLFQQINKLGWRKREPENLDIPIERPKTINKISELIYGFPLNTKKMASDLAYTPALINELVETGKSASKKLKEEANLSVESILKRREN